MCPSIIFTSLLVLIFLISNAFANSSSYYDSDGATVFPIENKNIVIKKEIVKISPKPETNTKWLAKCEFTFYNKSDSEELVTMGYPDWLNNNFWRDYIFTDSLNKKKEATISKYIDSDKEAKKLLYPNNDNYFDDWGYAKAYLKGYKEGKLPYVKEAWLIDDLKIIVDEKEVKTTHKSIEIKIKVEKKFEKEFAIKPSEPLGAFVWKVNFKPKETKTVKVTFSFAGLTDYGGYQEVSYLLRTGALWADKIGEADIYWDLKGRGQPDDDIHPKNYRIENNVIHWHFEDFEPNEDISILVGYDRD